MYTCWQRARHVVVSSFCCGLCVDVRSSLSTMDQRTARRTDQSNRAWRRVKAKVVHVQMRCASSIRDRILTMPDDESEVRENVLRHCEQGRLNHKNDSEFKCTTVVLRQMIAHKSFPNGNLIVFERATVLDVQRPLYIHRWRLSFVEPFRCGVWCRMPSVHLREHV